MSVCLLLTTPMLRCSDADEPNKILVEGTEQYCADLSVQPDDVVMLIIATHLKAKMCEFNRSDFFAGWAALG